MVHPTKSGIRITLQSAECVLPNNELWFKCENKDKKVWINIQQDTNENLATEL